MFKDKTVLITGGAGFIGSHLVDACLKHNAKKVIAFDNLSGVYERHNNFSHILDNRFKFIEGDMTNLDIIGMDAILQADVIFMLATSKLVDGLKSPIKDAEINILGNLDILEYVRTYNPKARIIFASTGSVYGTGDDVFKETDPKNPITVYGISKSTAEDYINFYHKNYGLKTTILRYFSVFGPRQDHRNEGGVVSKFIANVLKGDPPLIFGTGLQTRHFTPVEHVVNANLLAYQKDESIGQTYNVAYEKETSLIELAQKISGIEPDFFPAREGDAMRINPDVSKIKSLGLREKGSIEKTLRETREWIEERLE